jgi:hypothetical protein
MANKKFDAREYMAAIEPPTFIDLQGVEHVGKSLSFRETLTLAQSFEGAFSAEATEDVASVVTRICDAVGIPAEEVLKLPINGVRQVIESFFASLLGS